MPYSGNLAELERRSKHKTFLVLRPFEGALTSCSILIAETHVMIRKVYFTRESILIKAQIADS
jgi:hypothetical protein